MSPEELILLQSLGGQLWIICSSVLVVTILYGLYMMMFILSMPFLLCRGPDGRRPEWIMPTTATTSFIFGTMIFAAEVNNIVTLVQALLGTAYMPLDEIQSIVNARLVISDIIIDWSTFLIPIVTDSIVVWRAWVLFPDRRWIMAIPLFLLIGTLALSVGYLGMTSSTSGIYSLIKYGDRTIYWLSTAALLLSTATNVAATLLIAYKLWNYQKFIAKNLPTGGQRSPVQRVLFLLVESGAIYCTLQAVYIALTFVPATSAAREVAIRVYGVTYFTISAIYPTVVVILVKTKRSIVDTYSINIDLGTQKTHNQVVSPPTVLAAAGLITVMEPETKKNSAITDTESQGRAD